MMDVLVFALLLGGVALFFQRRDERRRIVLLGSHLGQYQIEQFMETLTGGYLRALGETDPARQRQIWNLLSTTEQALCEQFKRFATDVARADAQDCRVSKLPFSIFYTGRLLPDTTLDLRLLLGVIPVSYSRIAWSCFRYAQLRSSVNGSLSCSMMLGGMR